MTLFLGIGCRSPKEEKKVNNKAKVAISSINQKFTPLFSEANLHLPADSLIILVFKKQNLLQIWASGIPFKPKYIFSYETDKFSQSNGPKTINSGDYLPEGIYHLSESPSGVQFPNAFDLVKATADKRILKKEIIPLENLKLNKIETSEVAGLISLVGVDRSKIIVSPTDFRNDPAVVPCPFCPNWYAELYDQLRFVLSDFK